MKFTLLCLCVCLYIATTSALPKHREDSVSNIIEGDTDHWPTMRPRPGPIYVPSPTFPRHRRSPAPEDKDKGTWNVGVDKNTHDGGARVRAEAQQKWDVTQDKKVQAEVHGHWEREYGGANHGRRDHGYGGSIGGSWGKK